MRRSRFVEQPELGAAAATGPARRRLAGRQVRAGRCEVGEVEGGAPCRYARDRDWPLTRCVTTSSRTLSSPSGVEMASRRVRGAGLAIDGDVAPCSDRAGSPDTGYRAAACLACRWAVRPAVRPRAKRQRRTRDAAAQPGGHSSSLSYGCRTRQRRGRKARALRPLQGPPRARRCYSAAARRRLAAAPQKKAVCRENDRRQTLRRVNVLWGHVRGDTSEDGKQGAPLDPNGQECDFWQHLEAHRAEKTRTSGACRFFLSILRVRAPRFVVRSAALRRGAATRPKIRILVLIPSP